MKSDCLVVVAAMSFAFCAFAHRDLHAQEPRLRSVLDGHTALVTSLAVAPDGDFVVSGSLDGTVRIWDLATASERAKLSGHAEGVWWVLVMPTGDAVVSSSQDGTMKLWSVATGTELSTAEWRRAGSITPGGGLLVGPDDGTVTYGVGAAVRSWNVAGDVARGILERPSRFGGLHPWGFTKDGGTLVVSSYLEAIILWDMDTGRERLIIPDENVLSVAIAPDETRLAAGAGAGGGAVNLWDMATGALLSTLQGHTARVWDVEFSPDGTMLASAGWDGAVRLWDVATGGLLATLQGLSRFYSVAFTPDGNTLIAAGGEAMPTKRLGRIMLWDLGSR